MMPSNKSFILDDEPTKDDRLNRKQYAKAFANISQRSNTPLVIGLYATWGVGKTSLMKLIDNELNKDKTEVIWFNLWEQQSNENPALALAQAVANTITGKGKRKARKYLTLIAAAFGNRILKSIIGLNLFDTIKLGGIYEDENFQKREYNLKLKDHFKKIVKTAIGDGVDKRLVFFIDDLDRCTPDKAFMLIEALKLYLNIKGCIYSVF